MKSGVPSLVSALVIRTADRAEYHREYQRINRERLREYYRQYQRANRERIRKYRREWYRRYRKTNPEHCREVACSKRKRLRLHDKDERIALKIAVLSHYSGGDHARCVRCGFDDLRALTLDHITDNGATERRRRHVTGINLLRWLRRRGFPPGYQTLCANCNLTKEIDRREAAFGAA